MNLDEAEYPAIESTHVSGPGFAGKPINLLAGSETFTRSDITIGTLIPITLIRRYNSKSGYDSPSGYGWAHNYDKRLYTYADGAVVIRKENGWKRRFTPTGTGYATPVGETGTLVLNQDGAFTYTEKNGVKELYDPKGRLTSIPMTASAI